MTLYCHQCGAPWISDKKRPAVKEMCEACDAYLHCCMNCRFSDRPAPNVSQVLHVLNSPEIQAKLTHDGGYLAELSRRPGLTDPQLIDELYLTFFSRHPSDHERTTAQNYLQKHAGNRQAAIEDLAWSMLNSLELVFNH